MQYNESTHNLIPFFRKLANDIESRELTPKQMVIAGQLFMSWEFNNSSDSDNDTMSEEDVKKYLFTGWYIYNNLMSKDNVEDESDDDEKSEEDVEDSELTAI